MGLATKTIVRCYLCNKKLKYKRDKIFGYPFGWRSEKVKRTGWVCHICYHKLMKWRPWRPRRMICGK